MSLDFVTHTHQGRWLWRGKEKRKRKNPLPPPRLPVERRLSFICTAQKIMISSTDKALNITKHKPRAVIFARGFFVL
jgi:hypothetical protein